MTALERLAPVAVFGVSAALMLGALGFQYLGGLAPCPLCIIQRYPHVVVIALGLIAGGHLIAGKSKPVPYLMALASLALLVGAGIGAFHAGVEYGWWAGLEACAGGGGEGGLSMEKALENLNKPVARCDEVPWSLFGISMAGWNFLISAAAGLFGLWASWRLLRKPA